MLIAVCVLSPAQLEHVLGFTSFRLRFRGVLRGRFVPRTWFERVPAGTVLVGTQLFRSLFRLQEMVFSENMFQLEPYREHVCERPDNHLHVCISHLTWVSITPDDHGATQGPWIFFSLWKRNWKRKNSRNNSCVSQWRCMGWRFFSKTEF